MKQLSFIILAGLAGSSCVPAAVATGAGPEPSSGLPQASSQPARPASKSLTADHSVASMASLEPALAARAAKKVVLAYGHTSHGSQIVDGMNGLMAAKGAPFLVGRGGLDLRDCPFEGAGDLGNPDFRAWAPATAKYLDRHPEVNAVMWSWCGELSGASAQDVQGYLRLMSDLERRCPKVDFIYMTGHLDGTGPRGTLHQNNERIRQFCRANGRILFDFEDIERFGPDGRDYLALNATDGCDYDSNGDGAPDRNWAIEWQNAHPGQWFPCGSAHSQPLNANRKAFAAWWLLSRLPQAAGS